MTEEIEVRLRNQKKERVEVMVKENLYRWVNWSISVEVARLPQGGRAHDRVSGQRRRPTGEVVVRYTVQYTW